MSGFSACWQVTTIVALALFFSLFPSVSGACLPCQAAFRRPDGTQQTLHARDSTGAARILNPSFRSVWISGELQLVTWNTTDISPQMSDSECQVYLARWNWSTKEYQKIYIDDPLASNCIIRDGNTTVRVPRDQDKFKPDRNWVVVLLSKYSNDHSPPFTIAPPPQDQSQ